MPLVAPPVFVPLPLLAGDSKLELMGTAPDRKKLVLLEGGHVPNDRLGVIRNVLDWFDTYLGPVK